MRLVLKSMQLRLPLGSMPQRNYSSLVFKESSHLQLHIVKAY